MSLVLCKQLPPLFSSTSPAHRLVLRLPAAFLSISSRSDSWTLPAARWPRGRRWSAPLIFLIVFPGRWSVNSLGNWIVVALWATCARQFSFYRRTLNVSQEKRATDLLRTRTCPLNLINAEYNFGGRRALSGERGRFNFPGVRYWGIRPGAGASIWRWWLVLS